MRGGIGLIEGIGDQHRRPRDGPFPRQRREDRREQSLARAVERQHLRFGIDAAGEGRIAAPSHDGDGLTQRRDAADRRVSAELAKMALKNRPEERRDQRAGLAEREVDGALLARCRRAAR